jgi:hypothetical protein
MITERSTVMKIFSLAIALSLIAAPAITRAAAWTTTHSQPVPAAQAPAPTSSTTTAQPQAVTPTDPYTSQYGQYGAGEAGAEAIRQSYARQAREDREYAIERQRQHVSYCEVEEIRDSRGRPKGLKKFCM